MKICSKCHIEKGLNEFNRKTSKLIQPYCRACQKLYYHEYYYSKSNERDRLNKSNKKRKLWLREIVNRKKDVPCADCGRKFHPIAMDFDHIGEDKTRDISKLCARTAPLFVILREIEKCEVVCACCHRIRTYNRHHGHVVQ